MKMKQDDAAMTIKNYSDYDKHGRKQAVLLTMSGLFAAMITVMTAYICHIPDGINGGYIHFGDALIYVCAALLPQPYALAAASIGGGLADLLTAPMWVPATIIIKILITLPFTCKKEKLLCTRNIVAAFAAFAISGLGYYFAESLIFGTYTAFIASITGNAVQSGGSAAIFFVLAAALDKMHLKVRTNQMIYR